ncbi:unnamed protein product [Plutella xylostella]|uniref:(diamondback moth) hypothetical protein n=1 Tax=Plutella xylostella TaxID=51655 RepID=A0A8S4DWY3_PLUXY|nr:unnamed protein product [Plutella xylostella]
MQNILKLCGILILVFAEISNEMKSETPIRNSSAEIMTKPHSDLLLKLQKFLETHKDTENHLNEIRSKPTPLEHVESTTEISTFNSKLKQMNIENIAPKAQIEKQYKVKQSSIVKVNYTENKTNKIPKQLNNIASIIKKDTAMPIETDNNTHVFTMHFGKIPPSSTTPGTIRRSTNRKNYLRTQNEKNITTNENIIHDNGNTSLAINIETDDSESSESDSDEEQAETTTVATQQPQEDKHVEVKKNTYYITKTTTRLTFVNPIKEVMNKYLRVFKRRQQLIRRRKRLSEEELLFH